MERQWYAGFLRQAAAALRNARTSLEAVADRLGRDGPERGVVHRPHPIRQPVLRERRHVHHADDVPGVANHLQRRIDHRGSPWRPAPLAAGKALHVIEPNDPRRDTRRRGDFSCPPAFPRLFSAGTSPFGNAPTIQRRVSECVGYWRRSRRPWRPCCCVRPASRRPRTGRALTGKWFCDDGGTSYVRQVGDELWWTGRSGEPKGEKKAFANIFHGTIHGNKITGSWVEQPRRREPECGNAGAGDRRKRREAGAEKDGRHGPGSAAPSGRLTSRRGTGRRGYSKSTRGIPLYFTRPGVRHPQTPGS